MKVIFGNRNENVEIIVQIYFEVERGEKEDYGGMVMWLEN